MSAQVRLSVLVGLVFGLCGSIAGFVVAGLPGEVVGICVALPAAALFGVWSGSR